MSSQLTIRTVSKEGKKNKKGNKKSGRRQLISNILPASTSLGTKGRYGDFPLFSTNDPFPPRARTKLSFAYESVVVGGTGAFTFGSLGTIMNLNSVFQPTTSATHQPYGYDQLSGLYQQYKVRRCRATITASVSGLTQDDVWVGVLVKNSSSTATLATATLNVFMERPMFCAKKIAQNGSMKVVFHIDIPMHVIEGLTARQFEQDIGQYAAAVNANPALNPNVQVAICSSVGAGTIPVTIIQKMVYDVEFWERAIQSQS